MRIGGMASGFDTDQMIKDLMRVERMKVDRFYQQRQTIEWRKDEFRSIINTVRGFRDKYFDVLKPTYLMSPNAFKKMQAVSNNSAVSVTANSSAIMGETKFDIIQSATASRVSGENLASELSLSAKLDSFVGDDAFDADGNMELIFLKGGKSVNIKLNKQDTLRQVLSKINTSDAGMQMTYSSFTKSFTLVNKSTGVNPIETINDTGSASHKFFDAIGMTPVDGLVGGANQTEGRNAIFRINDVVGERSNNTFTIDGITYNINNRIDSPDGEVMESAIISNSVDNEAIFENIKTFIDDYNTLVGLINVKLEEQHFRSFQPLTKEQREAMSEKEIEQWESKAKSGLLRRDSNLESMLSKLRSVLYESVGNLHLTELGIETSSDFREKGKLVLRNDGADLKAAINNNPDKVVELFTKNSDISYSRTLTTEQRSERFAQSGIFQRMFDILEDNISTRRDSKGNKGILIERAGIIGDISENINLYDKQIQQVNKQIDRLEMWLKKKEDAYYRQFAAMEKALGQLYSQGDYMMMQMMQGK